MNKKLLRTSVIASVMAMAFTASAWAGDTWNTTLIDEKGTDTDAPNYSYKQNYFIQYHENHQNGTPESWDRIIGVYMDDAIKTNATPIDGIELTVNGVQLKHAHYNADGSFYTSSVDGVPESGMGIGGGHYCGESAQSVSIGQLQKMNETYYGNDVALQTAIVNEATKRSEVDIDHNNRISAIEAGYVKNVSVDQNNGSITFTSVVNGQAQIPVTYTDQHITGYTQTFDESTGKINSSITTNFGNAMNQTVDISGYVGTQIENKAAYADYSSTTQYGDNTIGDAIQQNTTNINNNTTAINNNTTAITNINNNNVSKVTYNNNDTWTIEQKIDGTQGNVTIKDTYVTGVSHELDASGNLVTTVTQNHGKSPVISNEVKIGNAIINYAGDIIIKGQDGSDIQLSKTIENSINNNYNKISAIESSYVSSIVDNNETHSDVQGHNVSHTWTVTQSGTDSPVTITDTRNKLFESHWLNQGLSDDIKITIADTAGNKLETTLQDIAKASLVGKLTDITGDEDMHSGVRARVGNEQGVTIATLVGEAYTEAYKKAKVESSDGNLIVTPIAPMSDEENTAVIYNVETNPDSTYRSITINPNIRTTGDFTGINMNNTNITNLAPGEISANSTEAINGSQLWETNRNMDKLGGRLDKVGAGAAALAALHPMDFDPDDKLQFSAGVGNYKGETAAALGAFYRPTEKVMFSVAGTMGNGENMVNAGVTFALDRKNNVSNSRVAMAHEIQDLRDQVAALTALVSQIAGKGNPLLDTVMFPDVPENHWAYDYVENLQKRGIIEGYPDGNFGGDRSMTRYEYAAMLYRALEKGFPVDGRLLKEFEAELGRIRIDRIKGADDDANKVERVRVNDYEDRDDYGSKLAQVVADAAPAIEEEPAA